MASREFGKYESYNYPFQSQNGSKEINTGIWAMWPLKQIEFSKPERYILRLQYYFHFLISDMKE